MEKKNAQDYLDGQLLLIDKPLKWTSFQVVNKLRWHIRQAYDLKKIKVGHAGTLDPLATGLLIICTGKMTKQINTFQEQIKTYTGTLELGSTTPSYDLETEIDHRFTTDHITNNIIYETINEFRGEIDQFPPVFSALKKEGKRLYEFARAGENVEIKSRKVTIHNFEVLNIKNKAVDFCVTCSKGTYIRSLAHDFGKALKSGAHLTALRRTKIGSYSVENAASIEDFILTLN
ncbi:tRNA pseudouridine(55) synthase TruB [Flavobacteriaceae bacterium]|jgi:tRNA pseudouridine55 synthase|nr:tRNA pseudouridine(55) synthase TruB [Flavobacteriaceae bacterium]MDC0462871.1 tRNA pseudouridine(55) synthase TruB [Flavobacteriaceae bacterium]MDC3350623.1 tRNA pseudouridine(55) synthase TruB [Flavobacteriaceae bacterium]|tara:strand:- start:2724 stop:3419 length:696 start_codon:yes stop_codon:yes gene_type:complete